MVSPVAVKDVRRDLIGGWQSPHSIVSAGVRFIGSFDEGTVGMVTIGVDPHTQTHSGVAVDPLGVQIAQRRVAARRDGFGALVEWARRLDGEGVWVIEDVRHVPGSLERFLIDRGETVVRLPPRLMAKAREGVRERGKSAPMDALAIARAALREGVETLPDRQARRPRAGDPAAGIASRTTGRGTTRMINGLRWQLHDLWPDWEIPKRVRIQPAWQTKVTNRLRRAPSTVRVQSAGDMIARVRELTRTIAQLYHQLAALVAQVAPQLLAESGLGVLIAPAATDNSTKPCRCSRSPRSFTTRQRRSTSPSSAAAARPAKKRSAASNATSSAASTTSSTTHQRPDHALLDIGAIGELEAPGAPHSGVRCGAAGRESGAAGPRRRPLRRQRSTDAPKSCGTASIMTRSVGRPRLITAPRRTPTRRKPARS
jgi:transposase